MGGGQRRPQTLPGSWGNFRGPVVSKVTLLLPDRWPDGSSQPGFPVDISGHSGTGWGPWELPARPPCPAACLPLRRPVRLSVRVPGGPYL